MKGREHECMNSSARAKAGPSVIPAQCVVLEELRMALAVFALKAAVNFNCKDRLPAALRDVSKFDKKHIIDVNV